MELDRTVIDDSYSVLPFIPAVPAKETLQWCTNIFISAVLSETRSALADYPAIMIVYTIVLTPDTRAFVETLPETAKSDWVVPYFPHITSATQADDRSVTISSIEGSTYYPYDEFCVLYDYHNLVYCKVDKTTKAIIEPASLPRFGYPMFAVPAFKAQITPMMEYQDVGAFRYGGELKLEFRMKASGERAMTYHVDDFDFATAANAPLAVKINRRQSNFTPKPSGAYAYRPVAYRAEQTVEIETTFFLCYNEKDRHDYPFRGVLMQGLGSRVARDYLGDGFVYRLADDKVDITYNQGHALAKTILRRVQS